MVLGCWVLALSASAARSQVLPEQPISLAGGHFVFGAEVTGTFAPGDPGYFNYTSYEFSALRNLRMGVLAEIRANEHIQVLGEVRARHNTACLTNTNALHWEGLTGISSASSSRSSTANSLPPTLPLSNSRHAGECFSEAWMASWGRPVMSASP